MKKLVILPALLLGCLLANAQRNYAVGILDSKTAKPVAGASIRILSSGKVSTTSESGNVVMFISPDDSLLVTARGYKARKMPMANQSISISIILDPLSPEIVPSKSKKKKTQKKS